MDNKMDVLLLILLIVYVVSPIDLMPGPIDDLIMCLLYFYNNKKQIVG